MARRSVLLIVLFVFGLTVLFSEAVAFSHDLKVNKTQTLVRRQCEWNAEENRYTNCDLKLPTIPQMLARMYDSSHKGRIDSSRHAVFYTNLDDPILSKGQDDQLAWFHDWLKKENLPYYWIWRTLDNQWYSDQQQWISANEAKFPKHDQFRGASELFELCYMQAIAQAALNPDAYFFTKKDTPWKYNSIWENIEYPWLTRNLAVKRIWRVDPRPPEVKGIKPEEACEHDKKELLWERSKDAALKPDFDCPVK